VRELLPAETVGWQSAFPLVLFLELNRQVFVTKRGARHLADHGQSGSYAPEQTFNDAGQKSAWGKFHQIANGKRASSLLPPSWVIEVGDFRVVLPVKLGYVSPNEVDEEPVKTGNIRLFRTRISRVSNNFKGCCGTAKHWKVRQRREDRG
jgi:hypothetical protein